LSDRVTPLSLEHRAAGEIVFRAGERGDAAYVIESGSVEILRGAPPNYRRINVRGPGCLIGEIALLDGKPVRQRLGRWRRPGWSVSSNPTSKV
jgi:CRP-like cAMP-binding protein